MRWLIPFFIAGGSFLLALLGLYVFLVLEFGMDSFLIATAIFVAVYLLFEAATSVILYSYAVFDRTDPKSPA